MPSLFRLVLIITLSFLALRPESNLSAQTTLATTFTYQGYLERSGVPVNGTCDIQFSLFNTLTAGTQIGSTVTKTNVSLSAGSFNVQLDFGVVFNGQDRFLALSPRCPAGSGAYTPLTPRQPITPTPYAISLYGLSAQYNSTSPNILGGSVVNSVTSGVVGAVVSGGGAAGNPNSVTDVYGTVSGGAGNRAGDNAGATNNVFTATVGGGFQNSASASFATVGGGNNNTANGQGSTIGGGGENSANGPNATVAGGVSNNAIGAHSTVGGGFDNNANNTQSTVGGGTSNTSSGVQSTVSGGGSNIASGQNAIVAGGYDNTASGNFSSVLGGSQNVASGFLSVVAGGDFNQATGDFATVPGGASNLAQGGASFAAGLCARALHNGSFVWGDSNNCTINGPFATSTAPNQFVVRANGGFRFITRTDPATGVPTDLYTLTQDLSGWRQASSPIVMENITLVDSIAILNALMQVPIVTWNYVGVDPSMRNLGPVGNNWHASFDSLGLAAAGEYSINTAEMDGVALASIQALYQQLQEKEARITALETQVASYETRLRALENIASGGNTTTGWMIGGLGLMGMGVAWLSRRRHQ